MTRPPGAGTAKEAAQLAEKNERDKPLEETMEEASRQAEESQVQEPRMKEPQTGEEPARERTELEKLQDEVAALTERNLRLAAEYDNYRKRTQRERDSIYPEAVAATLTALLPVLDNFQRALEAPCGDEGYVKGVRMIYDSLWETLKNMGLEEIGTVGEAFNTDSHNAVMHIEDDSLGKNMVAQVFQKGYRLGDRVLRHAMVQVAN